MVAVSTVVELIAAARISLPLSDLTLARNRQRLTTDHQPYAPPNTELPSTAAPTSRLLQAAFRVLGVASLGSAAFFVCWAVLLSSGASIFVFVILGLVSTPYLMLWLACRSLMSWSGMVLVALTLAGLLWLGSDAFRFVNTDAQGGLNLVFAPIIQLGIGFATMCLAVTLDWAERKLLATHRAQSLPNG